MRISDWSSDVCSSDLQSWGGAQSDGSTVEIVVDTLETPEGRRFQVMAVTTPAPVQETQEPKRVTDENIKALNAAYTGTWIVLGRDTYRIASVQRQYNTPTMVGVYVERLDHKGTVVGRTHTVLSPDGLAARLLRPIRQNGTPPGRGTR